MYSFANLIEHPAFLKGPSYNDAIIHPLLVALVSYVMGGLVWMTDVWGRKLRVVEVEYPELCS